MAVRRTILHDAVFLDKDGTLVENVPFNCDPRKIRLMPSCIQGLRTLQDAGFRLVVVSNQPGIALNLFPESSMQQVRQRLGELLHAEGLELAGFYYCPHYRQGVLPQYRRECSCRKPLPGMLQRAAVELQLDTGRSWMIGDILDDIEAGRRAGCRTVLLANGHEDRWAISPARVPDYAARTIDEAAVLIEAFRNWRTWQERMGDEPRI